MCWHDILGVTTSKLTTHTVSTFLGSCNDIDLVIWFPLLLLPAKTIKTQSLARRKIGFASSCFVFSSCLLVFAVWGGDPVYPTVNYIQDPDEVIDYRGPDFHEPTPNMLAYLKEVDILSSNLFFYSFPLIE